MDFIIEKTESYTTVGNTLARTKEISNKCRGFLVFILSLPPEWDFSLNGLVHCLKEGKKAVMTQIKEAKEAGFMKVEKTRGENGEFKYKYYVSDKPIYKELNENSVFSPDTQKGDAVKGDAVNGTQINTNKVNTNKQDKLDKLDKSYVDDQLQLPLMENLNNLTKQLIKRNFIDADDLDLFKYNQFLDELLNDCRDISAYKLLITVIGYVIAHIKLEKVNSPFAYFKKSVLENLAKMKNLEDTPELYSEDYCSNLWDELNSSNNGNLTFDNSLFDGLIEEYALLTPNTTNLVESVP